MRLSAADWNGLLRMYKAWAAGGARPSDRPRSSGSDCIYVYNDSGGDVGQFGVLALNGLMAEAAADMTEFLDQPTFCGVTPTADYFGGWFAVTLDPIKSGAVGRAVVSGIVPVRANVTRADHWWADVTVDSCERLTSGFSGNAQILYKESGTGIKWALVRLGQSGLPQGTLDNEVPSWNADDGRYYAGPVRAV